MSRPLFPRRRARPLTLVFLSLAPLLACQPSVPARHIDPDRPARVSFLSVPDGASVRLDSRTLRGTTPIEHEAVEPGLHVIEMELEGYTPVRLQRYWDAGAAERLDVRLEPLATATPTATSRPTVTPTAAGARATDPVPAVAPSPYRARTRPPARTATPVAARPATVSFRSGPPGAAVIVNGTQLAGRTPLEKVELAAGKASIEIRLPGHQPAIVERTLRPGADHTVQVELTPLPARVSFHSTPPGATVIVNGVTIEGRTPIENASIPAGDNEVTFELPDHASHTERHSWQADTEVRIEATLKPLDASVRFESDPPGATVLVNGIELEGKTPIGPVPMAPQPARVEFRLQGHSVVVLERQWTPNASDSILARLTPNPGRARFESLVPWDTLSVDGEVVFARPGGWVPLVAGPHRVLAVRGNEAAETDFEVPAGGDVVVTLDWSRKRPNPRDYVELPALTARLGSRKLAETNPERTVEVKTFWLARREVTTADYTACVEAGRCEPAGTEAGCNAAVPDRAAHPINCVSAHDALAYAAWLAEREQLPYRLPTADEWERAARGDGRRVYPWGDEPPAGRCNICDQSCALTEFRDDSASDGWPQTAPAGALPYCVSPEGILDLVGNVAEWCVADTGAARQQVRGGGWTQGGIFLDPALVTMRPATDRDPAVGFRLAISAEMEMVGKKGAEEEKRTVESAPVTPQAGSKTSELPAETE